MRITKSLSIINSKVVWYVALYGLLLFTLYYSSYDWLINHDWPREDYNYCYLIPIVILYLVWNKKREWVREKSIPSWYGLLIFLLGVLLFWFGELAGEFFSMYISSWLVVTGLLWIHTGWKKLRTMAFPLFVALFMFPLPYFLNTKLTFNLKLISSELGIKIIQLCGMSGYREGNVIDLGFAQLQVVDACSGLRYMIPLFLMAVLMAYLYRAAYWKKIIIVLSSIPLSIVTNGLRIALTAVLYKAVGPVAAEGFFHDFSGWAIFMVSFAILLAEIWVLSRIMPRPDESFMKTRGTGGDEDLEHIKLGGSEAQAKKTGMPFLMPQVLAAVVVLAATVAIHFFVDFREKTPIIQPFSKFPLVVGAWEGKRQFLEQQFIDVLEFSDYTSINYSKPDSPPVNVYVAYYESQRKGKSIHSPETCLPGSGWVFKQAGTTTIPLSGEGALSVTVMRALMEKEDSRQLVYFWFDQRGRVLTNAYEMKLYNLWDALLKKRTDGALVRIITPISSSEKIDDADRRLQVFIKDINPTLREFIPG